MVQSVVIAYTVSQKSRTGLRFALTDVSRAGTVDVSWSTACTPPVRVTSVLRIARRWNTILIRPTAVNTMIRPATAMVIQAAAGMVSSPSLAEQFRDGARVADRADLHFFDGLVRNGQAVRGGLELADDRDAAGQDVIARRTDALKGREHPVEQVDHDGQDHHEQDHVADPPQDHGWPPFACCQLTVLSARVAGRAGRTGGRRGSAPSGRRARRSRTPGPRRPPRRRSAPPSRLGPAARSC